MMNTRHSFIIGDSTNLNHISNESIGCVLTSPPYPMIAMWDESFSTQNKSIGSALEENKPLDAFEGMHKILDRVWREAFRVLIPGGFACINIGDATRTVDGHFRLYPNHARILSACQDFGFSVLPTILWRKPTNAPNKFMGSGMLPAGAYVTLEHEYILILRKGNKRKFGSAEDRLGRQNSAIFWEERNKWYSDVWHDVRGVRQKVADPTTRQRSGAFPLELAYRLICMYSAYGDIVVDPFVGTGTTSLAAIAAGRDSIGVDIDESLLDIAKENTMSDRQFSALRRIAGGRLESHAEFCEDRELKYSNENHGLPVMTRQEQNLLLYRPDEIRVESDGSLKCSHIPADRASATTEAMKQTVLF